MWKSKWFHTVIILDAMPYSCELMLKPPVSSTSLFSPSITTTLLTSIHKQDFHFARKRVRATRSSQPNQSTISISPPAMKRYHRSKKGFPARMTFSPLSIVPVLYRLHRELSMTFPCQARRLSIRLSSEELEER